MPVWKRIYFGVPLILRLCPVVVLFAAWIFCIYVWVMTQYIWVRGTKTSININISSAVLYFWSVLAAVFLTQLSTMGLNLFYHSIRSIISSGVLVPVRHIQTGPSEGARWNAADHSGSLPKDPPSLTSLGWWCVLTGTPSVKDLYCRYKLQRRKNSNLLSRWFSGNY